MIHYHGNEITPQDAGARFYRGRHVMISFARLSDIELVTSLCRSFVFDNGAFSFWKAGKQTDWPAYLKLVNEFRCHPNFDWAIVPDVIEGSEEENNALEFQWPFDRSIGVPVWHMHESLHRLERLCCSWPRVAIGSSVQYATIGTDLWWGRIIDAMDVCCDKLGYPIAKLHGLRMLDPRIFTELPLSSADSTNAVRNCKLDGRWNGTYAPMTVAARACVIADRVEFHSSAVTWKRT